MAYQKSRLFPTLNYHLIYRRGYSKRAQKKQGQPWLLLLEIIVIGAVLYKAKKLLKKITKQQDKRSLIKTSAIYMVFKKNFITKNEWFVARLEKTTLFAR